MLNFLYTVAINEFKVLPFLAFWFCLERMFSIYPINYRELRINLVYYFFWVLGTGLVLLALSKTLDPLSGNLKNWLAFNLQFLTENMIVSVLIGLLAFDLFYYWYHRLQHTWPALWHQHAVHHSEIEMNVTTAFRHHWLEHVLMYPIVTLPVLLLSLPHPKEHSIYEYIFASLIQYAGLFAHSNIRASFGRANWLFVTPHTHRIHHSIESVHRNKNFAAYFPLIDIIFGTYYAPKKDEWPKTGLKGLYLKNALELQSHPFKQWWRMFKKWRATHAG